MKPNFINKALGLQFQKAHIGISEGKEKKNGAEKTFKEIMACNFPNFVKDINLHIQEVCQTPNRLNMTHHSLTKILKVASKK